MINISYEIWKEACELVEDYSKKFGKYYLQLYPLYKYNNLSKLSTKEYFNSYIKSGAFLSNYDNFDKIDNYCRKNDGSYRNRLLLTPIMYIYYIAIGLYFSKKYNQKRTNDIYVKYAGNFDKKELHYRNSYQQFVNYVIEKSPDYNYYYKADISDFFNKINISILTKQMSNSFKFNQKEQMIFKEFIAWCGNGSFPQTECGVTSSYLATVIYLDIIDNRLYGLLKKDKTIRKFKMCRYVDDLYILLDVDGRINIEKLENRISSIYENTIYDYNLSINRKKCICDRIENIFKSLKNLSIFEDYDGNSIIPVEYKKHLRNFLDELVSLNKKSGINYQKYAEVANEYFNDSKIAYHASQILYIMIYRNTEWLEGTKIINKLVEIIEKDFNIVSVDPKIFVSMIVNTHNNELIKKFLHKLYCCAEEGQWTVSHSFIALQYLLNTNFNSKKLIDKMRQYSSKNVDFISKFYKNDWRNYIISPEIENQINKLAYNDTPISFFKFLEIVSLDNNNVLQAQAYNKNYFDSITKNIELIKGFTKDKNKVFYSKSELKDVYLNKLKISNDMWGTINELCDRRNKNPLCHANCDVFLNKRDISSLIECDIKKLNILIDNIIKLYF